MLVDRGEKVGSIHGSAFELSERVVEEKFYFAVRQRGRGRASSRTLGSISVGKVCRAVDVQVCDGAVEAIEATVGVGTRTGIATEASGSQR